MPASSARPASAPAQPRRAKPSRPLTGPPPKLAHRVATQIERDIIRRGWKVGEMLGSEAELAERHGTSRWVMREAISIMERDGLVEIRRGRKGGLAIASPALDVVGSSIRSYLSICRVSDREIADARVALESLALTLAAGRLDDGLTERLRAAAAASTEVDDENAVEIVYSMLHEILHAAGNAALMVFAYALAQLWSYLALRRGTPEKNLRRAALRIVESRRRQIEAVIAGDVPRAQALAREHIERSSRSLAQSPRGLVDHVLLGWSRGGAVFGARDRPRKRTDALTDRIEAEIVAADWPVGRNLGSEPALLQRYGVSRSVLREAIRPLERLGVVEMRRGKGSGLFVRKPDPQAVIRSVVLYLNFCGVDRRAVLDVLRVVEHEVVASGCRLPDVERLAATRAIRSSMDGQRRPSLQELERILRDFYWSLADLTRNPVYALFMRILGEMLRAEWRSDVDEAALGATLDALAQKSDLLLDAVDARDEALARRRMTELRRLEVAFGTKLRPVEEIVA
ncbi:MAG TPA: GntR family transcriptional regulator [Nevskiaceae bacterium]|nr:GntR family transcriptional regulator [Nevskiaceae bacterium]